ncbi:MAG: DNA methyltransferase, partial [Bacteroidales bacterium]|nr:DNA methyltransferase [Bacteroidales bacterium]
QQFEIIGITKTWFGMASKTYGEQTQIDKNGKESKVTKLNDGAVLEIKEAPSDKTYYKVDGKYYIQTYPRILIRKRKHD